MKYLNDLLVIFFLIAGRTGMGFQMEVKEGSQEEMRMIAIAYIDIALGHLIYCEHECIYRHLTGTSYFIL